MKTFRPSYGQTTLKYANAIATEIYGDDLITYDFSDYFEITEEVMNKALKPCRMTLLHDYINQSNLNGLYEALKDCGEDLYNEIYAELDSLNVSFSRCRGAGNRDYDDYLYRLHESTVYPLLVNDIFQHLFSNRDIMRELNLNISKKISTLRFADWPHHLSKDGVMIRCEYWNKWIFKALFRREQGHCAICNKDLTGLLSTEHSMAIDHIVPLNLGGVNDPTNLQILCDICNSRKGGNRSDTSNLYSVHWTID
jgi:hypothetical protein